MAPKSNRLPTKSAALVRRARKAQLALAAGIVLFPATSSALSPADLQRAADKSNGGLPRMVAANLRQEKITVSGMNLIYLYTHTTKTSGQLQPLNLSVSQRPYLFPEICTDSFTGRMLREGTTFQYVYRGTDGGVAGEVIINPADCNGR
jgi:hypothetical protein